MKRVNNNTVEVEQMRLWARQSLNQMITILDSNNLEETNVRNKLVMNELYNMFFHSFPHSHERFIHQIIVD